MGAESVEGTARVIKWPVVVTAIVEEEVRQSKLTPRYLAALTDTVVYL